MAAARRFSEEGAAIGITDLDEAALEQVEAQLSGTGGQVISVAGDISDSLTAETLVTRTAAAFGRLDILLNNAGIALANTVEGYSVDEFDRLMHVNCLAHLLTIQRVLPHMRGQRSGSIINVASIGALVALPHLAVYSASKAAVLGLTRGVAYECAEDGIRCNAICPGGVDTPMARGFLETFEDRDAALQLLTGRQLFKRFARAEEIAELSVFLASDEASFITGAVIPIEAGHSAW